MLRITALVLCLTACERPTQQLPQDVVRKQELDAQFSALEERLLTRLRDDDVDGCTRAVRLSKLAGGVIYVDSYGHCTFVRQLAHRRGRR